MRIIFDYATLIFHHKSLITHHPYGKIQISTKAKQQVYNTCHVIMGST